MEDLVTLFQMLPPEWITYAGTAMLWLAALRTGLRVAVHVCSEIDVALDGKTDWKFVGKVADVLDAVDKVLAKWTPVKAPLVLEKRSHAAPGTPRP